MSDIKEGFEPSISGTETGTSDDEFVTGGEDSTVEHTDGEDTKSDNNGGLLFWKIATLILALICIFLFIVTIVLVVLFVYTRYRVSDSDVEFDPIPEKYTKPSRYSKLSNLDMYSFSLKDEEKVVEGILFLPDQEQNFFHSDENKQSITTYFRTQSIPQLVSWKCRAKCGGIIDTRKFDLITGNKQSAISHFKGIMGGQDCEGFDIDCFYDEEYGELGEEEGGEEGDDSVYYECNAYPILNDYGAIKLMYREIVRKYIDSPPNIACFESGEGSSLAEIVGCAHGYFGSAVDHYAETYSFVSSRTGILKYGFSGCAERRGTLEDGDGDSCCGGSHSFDWF